MKYQKRPKPLLSLDLRDQKTVPNLVLIDRFLPRLLHLRTITWSSGIRFLWRSINNFGTCWG